MTRTSGRFMQRGNNLMGFSPVSRGMMRFPGRVPQMRQINAPQMMGMRSQMRPLMSLIRSTNIGQRSRIWNSNSTQNNGSVSMDADDSKNPSEVNNTTVDIAQDGFNRNNHKNFFPSNNPVSQVFFDMTHCESHFPKPIRFQENSEKNDNELLEILLDRHKEIMPDQVQLACLTTLVSHFTNLVDQMVVNPTLFSAAKIVEAKLVGAFKEQSLLKGEIVAQIVLVFGTLPTRLAVGAIAQFCSQKIQESYDNSITRLSGVPGMSIISSRYTDYGFEISLTDQSAINISSNLVPSIEIYACTTPNLISQLDSNIHIETDLQLKALRMIRQSRWFDENATHMNVRMLIRLLKDLAQRVDGLRHLNNWTINLLSHYAVMNNSKNQPMPVNVAFRRVFQLLAAGIFLPGSASIVDPCERGNGHFVVKAHSNLTLQNQDELCCAAQTMLRMFSHGGCKLIILSGSPIDIKSSVIDWNGIYVSPSEAVALNVDNDPDSTIQSNVH